MSESPPRLFIDTNILLSFFAFTSDDLEQLRKLIGLTKTGKLVLYTTSQVRDEFARNREKKLRDSIAHFEKVTLNASVPRFMEAYEDNVAEFQQATARFSKARNNLVTMAREEAEKEGLAADILVRELFAACELLKHDEETVRGAQLRMLTGNPPGKSGSIGDQLNWELLLAKVPVGVNLHIVSKDGDYESPFGGRAHQYLLTEWMAKKKSQLMLHTELKPLLLAYFPEIKLAIDIEKHSAMNALVQSGSFSSTHSAISKLEPFAETLTFEDVSKLAEAALTNSQINWISSDVDVRTFFKSIITPYVQKFDPETLSKLSEEFGLGDEDESKDDADDDIPF